MPTFVAFHGSFDLFFRTREHQWPIWFNLRCPCAFISLDFRMRCHLTKLFQVKSTLFVHLNFFQGPAQQFTPHNCLNVLYIADQFSEETGKAP